MNLFRLLFTTHVIISSTIVDAQQTPTTDDNNSTYVLEKTSPDIVFIVPDRATSYPNGLHNGILTSAYDNLQYTVDVVDYGNYDPSKSATVLNDAIDTPSELQPKVYCIWPMDAESKRLVGVLYDTHNVPIVQINQFPDDWELEHLLGYAGPKDAERAANAGTMMVTAFDERGVSKSNQKVVSLGYPASYGGYSLSIKAFNDVVSDSPIQVVKEVPLERPDLRQSAYNEIVNLIDVWVVWIGLIYEDLHITVGSPNLQK